MVLRAVSKRNSAATRNTTPPIFFKVSALEVPVYPAKPNTIHPFFTKK
jgi:hypothetical protein